MNGSARLWPYGRPYSPSFRFSNPTTLWIRYTRQMMQPEMNKNKNQILRRLGSHRSLPWSVLSNLTHCFFNTPLPKLVSLTTCLPHPGGQFFYRPRVQNVSPIRTTSVISLSCDTFGAESESTGMVFRIFRNQRDAHSDCG